MSTLARVVFNPDTTPPTTPGSVTASTLSQTAIRVAWSASTDTGGSGLAGYRVYRSTTSTGTYTQVGSDLTTASLSYDDTSLSAGSTRFYRIVAFDDNGNASAQSSTASATTQSGSSDNDGLVVNFGSFDPDAAQIISINVNSSIPSALSTGASVSHATETWWSGTTGVATMRPPTVEGYSGFNGFNLWKNATKVIRQINIRWEWRASDAYCANSAPVPKWLILNTYRTLSIGGQVDRPMLYINHMNDGGTNPSLHITDSIVFSPAQGTVRMFSSVNNSPALTQSSINDSTLATWPAMRQPMYVRATAGSDGAGNPIVDADEYLCCEMRVNTFATSDEPQGTVGLRITRQNGQMMERVAPFTWWDPVLVAGTPPLNTNYIGFVDVMGAGYFNNPSSGDPNIWNKVGRRLTFAFNYQPTVGRAWIGPPTGFVL